MTISIQVKCDVCKKIKQETNHWFISLHTHKEIVVKALDLTLELRTERITTYAAQDPMQKIFCGEACTLKYLSSILKNLNKQPQQELSDEFSY